MRLAFPDPALTDADIVLRHLGADDIRWITAACSDGELSRYIPVIPYPYSQSDAHTFIEKRCPQPGAGQAAGHEGIWPPVDDGLPVR